MIDEAVRATLEIFQKLSKEIPPNDTLFPIIFQEACTTYRSLLIEKRKLEEHNHKEEQHITDKQVKYLKYLAENTTDGLDIITKYLTEHKKENVEQLTSREASELIDKIKGGGK